MIDYYPPPPKPLDRQYQMMQNLSKYVIHITYLYFESTVYEKQWDTTGDNVSLAPGETYKLPIVGKGIVHLRWETHGEEADDTFEVKFGLLGNPVPYCFHGDKWSMMLRRAALAVEPLND